MVRLVAVQPLQTTEQSAPVKAYQILAREVRRVPVGLAAIPFVGRTREMAVLHAVWTQMEAGQGHVVGMVGEPGMGKSRLVQEFRRSLGGRPHTYVRGYCVSYGQTTPYQPVRTLLQHACGITAADGPTVIAAKVQRRLCALDMEARAAVSYLLLLMGHQEVPEQLAGLSPEAYKASMVAILLQMCLNGSRRRPLVIEVEDLHWVDASSEACLMALVERLAGVPLLLLVTYRPGYRPLGLTNPTSPKCP
jgi:predicted ATPase